MLKIKYALTGILVALTVVITILGNPAIIKAQEKCLPVYIRSHAGVQPETLFVAKGDCVVWINWTRGEDVKIIFREGKKCADMTKSPKGFKADFSGCYLTDYIGFGETSSLVFEQAGRFDYEVEFAKSGGGPYVSSEKIFGSIMVK